MTRRDDKTLDLLAWEPPKIVKRFDDHRVRTVELSTQLARAVSETLRDATSDRKEIAAEMSSWLGGDPVSKDMLDKYASQAAADHLISLPRAIALIHATGDIRLLQMIAEMFDHVVIESRWLGAVDDAIYADQIEQLKKERRQAQNTWKGGAR